MDMRVVTLQSVVMEKFNLPMDIYGNMQTKILLKECAEYGKKD